MTVACVVVVVFGGIVSLLICPIPSGGGPVVVGIVVTFVIIAGLVVF